MANLLSPGIQIKEYDLTGIVPSVSTTQASYVGQFQWGPLNTRMLIDTEERLYNTFWSPNDQTANDWFTASNFLAYGDLLWLVRVGNETDANSALTIKNATTSNSHGFLVRNNEDYEHNFSNGQLKSQFGCGDWIAKYPGEMGNSIKMSVCTSANTYQSSLTGTLSVTANTNVVTGTGTNFLSELTVGDILIVNGEDHHIAAIANTTSLTLDNKHTIGAVANTAIRRWEYFASFNVSPGTSQNATNLGASSDEMHIVIVDALGLWTGQRGEVIESYPFVSKASDSFKEDGTSNYYKDVINSVSKYVRWAGHPTSMSNWGQTLIGKSFATQYKPLNYTFSGGEDGKNVDDGDRIRGWSLFQDKETTTIDIVIGGAAGQTLSTWLINNLAERRKDCIAFISPPRSTVVNNPGYELNALVAYRNTLPSSSYVALDNNWKYQYDRYNDVNRWVPCSGDIAGIHVASDEARDAWWAAAGLNRGQLKNVIKLAWNPTNSDRDVLYPNGINPVVTFPGKGTYLFGQKTLLSKPSAFDRINVRRLFLYLERAIGEAAKYFLFEFNDAITRAQFVNMVEPFLKNVQGRRGIYQFKVVCDESNNTGFVIDSNQFIADIYIKPARVAEYITLNFIATPIS